MSLRLDEVLAVMAVLARLRNELLRGNAHMADALVGLGAGNVGLVAGNGEFASLAPITDTSSALEYVEALHERLRARPSLRELFGPGPFRG